MSKSKGGNNWRISYISASGKQDTTFAMKPKNLLYSKPYIELTPNAKNLYDYLILESFEQKWQAKYGCENLFEFTAKKAAAIGLSAKTFQRCIKELETKGFIERRAVGHGNHPSTYSLSGKWRTHV